jgi:hypothetical protein
MRNENFYHSMASGAIAKQASQAPPSQILKSFRPGESLLPLENAAPSDTVI